MRKEFIILIAAVLMGAAAVVFNQIHRTGIEEELRAKISAETQVVQVNARIAPGMILEEMYLSPVNFPTLYVHPMAVVWTDRQRVIGQEIRVPIQPGQPLLWSDMIDGSQQSINDIILSGRGVITLPIDNLGSVAGMVQPGSRVDVVGIFNSLPTSIVDAQRPSGTQPNGEAGADDAGRQAIAAMLERLEGARPGDGDEFYMVTVARNLTVFAVGSHTQLSGRRAAPGYNSISFDVAPGMQATLLMAQEHAARNGGRLLCVLRSPDTKTTDERLQTMYKSRDLMRLVENQNAQ